MSSFGFGRAQTHDDDEPSMGDGGGGSNVPVPDHVNLPTFNSHVDIICGSDDAAALMSSVQYMRKLLSVETNPAVDLVVSREQLVERLCELVGPAHGPALRFEAAWAVTNIASGNSSHCAAAMKFGAHTQFMGVLTSAADTQLKEQAIWGLGNIAGDGVHARDMCLAQGALGAILQCFPHSNPAVAHPPISFLRNATWGMSNLVRGKPQPAFSESQKDTMECLAKLVLDVTSPQGSFPWQCAGTDSEVLVDALWGLSYLTTGEDERLQVLVAMDTPAGTGGNPEGDGGAAPGVVRAMVQCLGHHEAKVVTPALRTLGNLVTGTADLTACALSAGLLPPCFPLLSHSKASIRKEVCWTLSNITAGTTAQKQAVLDLPWFLPGVYSVAVQDSSAVAREAVYALANLLDSASPAQVVALCSQRAISALLHASAVALESGNQGTAAVAMSGLASCVSSCQGHNAAEASLRTALSSRAARAVLGAGELGSKLAQETARVITFIGPGQGKAEALSLDRASEVLRDACVGLGGGAPPASATLAVGGGLGDALAPPTTTVKPPPPGAGVKGAVEPVPASAGGHDDDVLAATASVPPGHDDDSQSEDEGPPGGSGEPGVESEEDDEVPP